MFSAALPCASKYWELTVLKKFLIFFPLYFVWVMVALAIAFGSSNSDSLQFLSVILYLVLIMIPVWLFTKWLNYVPRWVKAVEDNGKEAIATVVSVKDTGMIINRTIVVIKVRLRVEPIDDAPFEITQEKQVSLLTGLGGYASGTRVKVKYDPANKKHVVIVGEEVEASPHYHATYNASSPIDPKPDVVQELAELSKLHKSGELSDAEFAAAKKKFLG